MRIVLVECNPFMPAATPISLGYIASFLKTRGHEVWILSVAQDTLHSLHSCARFLATTRPKVVGFAIYQRNVFHVLGWARFVKAVVPDCYVVVGGPQAAFLPAEALGELDAVDFVCRAEGEDTLAGLIEAIEAEEPLVGLDGLMGRYPGGEGVWEGRRTEPTQDDLDAYPSPYLDGTLTPRPGKDAILLASRGCPYDCVFCYTPSAFGRKVRYHSVERVVEEILWIGRHGTDRFWFADPSFTMNQARVERLIDMLLSKQFSGRIWVETRADLVSRELLEKMRRAGVATIAYGLEAVSGEVLRRIRKHVPIDRLEAAIRWTQEAGIEVELFSQYGLPGQDFEDASRTLEFVKRMNVKIQGNTNAQQMQVYFGTEICKHYEAYGIRPIQERIPSCLSIGSRYETEWLSAEEIRQIHEMWRRASLDGGTRIVS